jgi:hypothetical protein
MPFYMIHSRELLNEIRLNLALVCTKSSLVDLIWSVLFQYHIQFIRSSIFFLCFLDGVRLSLFDTSATNWPIVPAPDDR